MAIAEVGMGVTPAVAESDDDDSDKDLLLDWRGKEPSAGAVQRTLGFKQVKQRFLDGAAKTMVRKEEQPQQLLLGRDEQRKGEVNKSFDRNVAFVSLSDDEDDPPAARARRKDAKAASSSVKHADVVCLDSDSESELKPSVQLKGKASEKFGKLEDAAGRRSWEKARFPEELGIGDTVPGLSNLYEVTPSSALDKHGEARKDASPSRLLDCSINNTSKSSKLDRWSLPCNVSAPTTEGIAGLRSSGVFSSRDVNAGSSSGAARTEFALGPSEDRVLNCDPKVSEGPGAHEDWIAKPPRRGSYFPERAAALSVYNFEDEVVPESRGEPGSWPPASGPELRKCSEKFLVPTSVKSTKSSLPRAKMSQEKLNIASAIIVQDLTTSDDDDKPRNPNCRGSTDRDEMTLSGFGTFDLDSGRKSSLEKNCSQSQEWLKQGKSGGLARSSFEELSADEAHEVGEVHALRDRGESSRVELPNRTKVSAGRTSDGLAAGVWKSRVSLCDHAISDDEKFEMQMSSKRKCIRSAEDPIMEERSKNLDALDFDCLSTRHPVEGEGGRKRLSSDKTPSAFEAVKEVIQLGKLEKQRQRELEREARNQLKLEEKERRQEESRRKREELRQQKEAAKAEAAGRKKIEQECFKWKKGKFALENTTVYVDKRIIESKALGPPLLQQLASKGYTYQVVTNRVEKTVVWTMKMPTADSEAILDAQESQDEPISNSQLSLEEVEIKYVVVFLDAAEFADMVAGDAINNHISRIKGEHPGYTICYLVNNLTRYIYKKEQIQYRTGDMSWKRPNVEKVLAEFVTHHTGVRSRLCIDENEMAEHIVGLTRSLAECPFKPKVTSLTINANGEHISKNDPFREVIKKDPWKKALAAIPHMTGAAVIAITKLYPTMRALLNVYLDPNKTDLEKDFLLQNLVKDAALGSARAEGRRVGPVCSKRIHRLLMAQNGNLKTEAAEEGEDYFRDQQC